MTTSSKVTLPASLAAKTSAAAATQAEAPASKLRIFTGQFSLHENFMTPTGKVASFYKGFCVTEDAEIVEFLGKVPHVTDVTGQVKLEDVPQVPSRQRGGNWAAASSHATSPTTINPMELLQRAVASSAQLPQAAESSSGVAAPQ